MTFAQIFFIVISYPTKTKKFLYVSIIYSTNHLFSNFMVIKKCSCLLRCPKILFFILHKTNSAVYYKVWRAFCHAVYKTTLFYQDRRIFYFMSEPISYWEEIKRKMIHLSSLWMVVATIVLPELFHYGRWIACALFGVCLFITLVSEHDYANGGNIWGGSMASCSEKCFATM